MAATVTHITETATVQPLIKRKAWVALKEHQKKVRSLHLRELKLNCEVEVDGGADEQTGPLAAGAGADVFVAGSSIFGDQAGVVSAMGQLCTSIAHHRGVLQI
jgi:pentose-5-phosphate-3-epimerase